MGRKHGFTVAKSLPEVNRPGALGGPITLYSVAYWYQKEPHASFPPLPPVEERIPKFKPTGGPGQDPAMK